MMLRERPLSRAVDDCKGSVRDGRRRLLTDQDQKLKSDLESGRSPRQLKSFVTQFDVQGAEELQGARGYECAIPNSNWQSDHTVLVPHDATSSAKTIGQCNGCPN